MARTLHWSETPEGGQVAAISITSAGAHGLRLGLVVDAMPDAAELRLYRKDRSKTGFETTGQAINEAIARNRRADGDTRAAGIWWTPDLGADEVTLEITACGTVDIAAAHCHSHAHPCLCQPGPAHGAGAAR
jgi:hypothetical protein